MPTHRRSQNVVIDGMVTGMAILVNYSIA